MLKVSGSQKSIYGKKRKIRRIVNFFIEQNVFYLKIVMRFYLYYIFWGEGYYFH